MNARNQKLKQEIKNSLVNCFQQLCDFREIQNLSKVLNDDEDIIQAVNGLIPHNNNGTGLIILTQKRVAFFNHRLLFSSDFSSIPLSKINSVTPKRGVFYGKIDFDNGAATFTASHVLAWKCQKFVNAVDKELDDLNENDESPNKNSSSNPSSPSDDDIEQLTKLEKLLKEHVITQNEFEREKNKIINHR